MCLIVSVALSPPRRVFSLFYWGFDVRRPGNNRCMGKIKDDEYVSWIDQPEDSLFRLGGFGGSGLTLRTCMNLGIEGSLDFGVDVGILSPDRFVNYLARPVAPDFIDKLAAFFWACAAEQFPEKSVATFIDDSVGINLSVMSSKEFVVELQVHIVEVLGADIPEIDVVNFETSRVALTTAAEKVRLLNQSEPKIDIAVGG